MQPAAATDASTQTTDQAEFGNVTAAVTKETLFTGKVSKVRVTFTAPEGEQVDITVADETETVTATGSEQSVSLRVGAFFFFGEKYPVDVSASIQDGETVEGTINADDGVVVLKEVSGEPDPAFFEVGDLSTNSPVTEGETLEVTTTVTNTGDETDTKGVGLVAAQEIRDVQNLTLAGGESQTVTLTWTTQAGDAGDTIAVVSTANDSAQANVTVEEPPTPTANFQVSNLQAPAEATVGDTITVSADVENTGGAEGTQSVDFGLDTDGDGSLETQASQQQTLAANDSTTVTFDVDTSGLPADTYTHGVSTANDTETAQITLNEPVPDNGTISGTVLDANGNAIAGATVSADGVTTTTATDGSYSLSIAPGTYDVTASATDFLSATQSATVTENNVTDVDFTLEAEPPGNGTIAGTVTDTNGNALAGATVTVNGQSTTTASDGSYSLTVAPSDYTVEANADGYQSATQQATVTEGDTTTVDFSLTPEDGTISGVVQDTNGNNLVDATVTANGQSTTTASDGSYSLTVAPGTYTVEASAQDYDNASASVSVGPGEAVTQDFTLEMEDMGPKPFTAYVRGEESYLHTGTPNNSRPILYSRCRDGEPTPAEQGPDFLPTDGCIQIDGTIFPSNNTWRGDVDFPPARDIINETQSDTIGNVYFRANLTVVGQAGGTFNVDTGRTSLETTVDIGITVWTIGSIFNVSPPAQNPYDQVTSDSANRLSDPGCNLPSVSINVSTEKSYQTGSPFPATSTVSGERINDSDIGKLVSDDFDVQTAEGCGSVFGVNINDQVNAEQGLPAGPGDNEAAYLTEFNIQTGS
ncbi:carboxypeptidase regulatory-like domain-containing protein [Halorientalis pallida]|uniref:carboxypeptidase regulatory-like domain-containing protein n=1 Tax=Halorientalis pallida TaxID=2479928 RepID=UPI00187D6416|nr:carboxypeptidase regulatory-like domain-containing protein [Halorientalis pallida]